MPKTVKQIKEEYPEGCRVELVSMKDEQAPPVGTRGTVRHVDDIGTIHIAWDNGQGLGVVDGIDSITKI